LSLLQIEGLNVFYYTREGVVEAVDGVNLRIGSGESFGIIGESGCGKSTIALSVLGLVPNPGRITKGSIIFDGEDLVRKTAHEMQSIRGGRIAMVFQDPMSSLNPVLTIGDQIGEAVILHQKKKGAVEEEVNEALKMVGIATPDQIRRSYPYQLSGGMRQRVMIAMALSCRPDLLIADEPTTALDVTMGAQILDLVRKLRKELGMALLWITHNLGVVAEMCDRVAVMYAGRVVEVADIRAIYHEPLHPYTNALLGAVPVPGRDRLKIIKGTVPKLINPPKGCRFADRCEFALDVCRKETPSLEELKPNHFVACWVASGKSD
jgi:oligopeptide/dipeptide ABC transporter ATP-binding protein